MEKQLTMATSTNARYVLFVLLAVYVNNMWARYLLVYLYAVSDENYDDDGMKNYISITDATGISTSEYGILVGYGFSFCYVVFGLVMGRAADVYNRKLIVFYGLVIWSFATLWLGLSNNYTQLLQSRILLGIGQSFSMPASFSMIADYFPVESLAQANGIYVAGIYIGGGLSSLSIAIAESIGWRGSAYAVAAGGFALAFLLRFTVKEPVRVPAAAPTATPEASGYDKVGQGARDPERDQNFTIKQSLALIFGEPLFLLMIFGGMVRLMGAFTLASYLPDFYGQVYPDYNTVYSYLNATVVSIGGALSSYLGGYAADRWERAGEKKARLYIPAIGALLGAPAFFMVVVSPSFYASMFFLFVEFLVAECWYGPLISVLQKFLPPRARGVGIGCYSFCIIVAGSSMTYGLGLILDNYTSDAAIKHTLIVGVCGMYVLSAFIYLIASRFMPEMNSGPLNGSERQPLLNKAYDELEADSHGAGSRPNSNGAARNRSSARGDDATQ